MPAKINHIAIVSQQYALLSYFYQSIFGMKTSATNKRTVRAITVGDGYVGLNINPRKAGRPAGMDHFGVEVDDAMATLDRMKTKYPASDSVQRPSTRPFAGISANDPDGNVFDISQKKMENRTGVYVENTGEQNERFVSHVALRTLRPDEMARFYSDVFHFEEKNAKAGDPNHYLSDGKVTLVIMPWKIANFVGQSILPTGIDHFGFTVEDVDQLKADIDDAIGQNPLMAPIALGRGKEAGNRLELARKQAPYAEHFISDPDFSLIAISARA
jgi:catechol 2,3-dioxygenase-like lactoylglutathione lyase family enzyme